VTSVGGVFKDIKEPNSRFTSLSVAEAKKLITENIISGGMIPKVEEAFPIVESSHAKFFILSTREPDTLFNELKNPGATGTVITA